MATAGRTRMRTAVRIRRTLRRFIAECRAHRTPVAIALFPHLSAGLPTGAYEYADLHDQVLEICREESVPCVDLRATFAPYRDYLSLWVNRFDAHPNAHAHRLAGERILEVLGPLWLASGARLAAGPAPEARRSVEATDGVPERPDPVDRDAHDVARRQRVLVRHQDAGAGREHRARRHRVVAAEPVDQLLARGA